MGDAAGPHWALAGNGDLAMTMPDLASWAHALCTGGIVAPEAVDAVVRPGFDHGDGTQETPGWVAVDASTYGERFLTAAGGGGDVGHDTVVVWLPETERAVAVASNTPDVTAGDLVRAVGPALATGDPLPSPGTVGDVDPAQVAEVSGTYTLDTGGSFHVAGRDARVTISARGADAVAALFPPAQEARGAAAHHHHHQHGLPVAGPVMTRPWRSLRVQLAVLGFLAIYAPVLLLFGVTRATEHEAIETIDGVEVGVERSTRRSPWPAWTVVALAPGAGALAWWWAGRALRPVDRVRAVADDIEASDLGRRIGLTRGPAEVVSLAASFDTMLGRLEDAADTQRRLVEEASHELRTPLSLLATTADVTLATPDPTIESYRRALERSQAAVARLQATIEDMLVDTRGRARTLDRQPADLVAIARGVAEDARVLAAAKEITLSVSGPPRALCPVDEPPVVRAVSNLVDNAVRYAPEGTTVEIDVSVADGATTVAVTDHGPGVPPDEQAHIFERFWRGRRDTHGTGLGLPIAQQIARAHGGDLSLRSPGPAGDGSSFALTLRCRRPEVLGPDGGG